MPRFTRSLLAAAALAAPVPLASPAARLTRAASPDVFWAHLQFLSSDLLEGRGTATRGGLLAAGYIATTFQRLGLQPAGDSGYYFRVPIVALTPDPTLAASGSAERSLGYRSDYVLWSMRNEETAELSSPAVFVGYGIVAPEWHWDDYAGVDARGKIVICLVNDPGLHDSTIFRGRILTYYGRWTYKIEEAARHGAAGILMVHTAESATYPWSVVAASWTGEQVRLETEPTSLVVAGWIRDSSATQVFADAGLDLPDLMRRAGARGFSPVALPFGFNATVKSTIRRSETYDVIGRLPGRGRRAKEAVLIGGHYDHFGIRTPVNGDSIYNGAEDNASGTAAVLTAAEAFVRSGVTPERSVLFVGFGAEESGLLGSEALAQRSPIPLKDLAAVLNMDGMNLYGLTRDIAALGTEQSSLGSTFQQSARAEGLSVIVDQDALERGYFFRSDHFPFALAGVPALSLEGGENYIGRPQGWGKERKQEYIDQRYHQPQDEILPWFTPAGAIEQLRVVLRTALAAADAPQQPTWNKDSEFKAAGDSRRGR
jgi:Zn-dependent M28 family amino/carboxypeptidase